MSSPNPFGLDAMMQRYQPTQLGASATLGNPQAMKQDQQSVAQMLEAYKQAQARQAQALDMMQPQYVQNSGGLGALAMIAQAAAGKHLKKKADESAADYAQRIGEAELDAQRRQAEAQAQADERKYRQRIELEREKGRIRAEQPTDAIRTLSALAEDPRLAALDQQRKAAGAARTNVNMPVQQGAFQKALGSKQADQFVTWQADAVAANEVKQQLSTVKNIMALQQTGKIDEAKAMIGQYFGTAAGADLQAWNASVAPLILNAAAKLKPLSNADIDFVKKSMPSFGFDPRANARIVDILDSAADRQIGLFNDAASYVEEKKSLDGFRPTFSPRASDAPAQQAQDAPKRVRYNPETGEFE